MSRGLVTRQFFVFGGNMGSLGVDFDFERTKNICAVKKFYKYTGGIENVKW